ncbi:MULTISPECIES: hypothetical protein [unclassified Streptococcus]|uniref:hypothetical protein n=1 Tax=unclassified Streptococcus TaxID=2608887 RepID=UPI00069D0772|nr:MULTISPECIES: hypothetical protein [unclassified Streptococcus]
MKKQSFVAGLLALVFLFVGLSASAQVHADTPLYRLYHTGLKVHLYTKDSNEYAVLAKRGWSQEGTAWTTSDNQGDVVYRLYHKGLKVHLYTKDANEYTVLAKRGWNQEGTAFYGIAAQKTAQPVVPEPAQNVEEPIKPEQPVLDGMNQVEPPVGPNGLKNSMDEENALFVQVIYKTTDGAQIFSYDNKMTDKLDLGLQMYPDNVIEWDVPENYRVTEAHLHTLAITLGYLSDN